MAPTPPQSSGKTRLQTKQNGIRRQKIIAELEAKNANSKEVWALQHQLITSTATQALMDAARQLLQPEHYEAIIEERALEGFCGFPLCPNCSQSLPQGKRWSVDYSDCKVYKADEVSRFCSVECRRLSSAFCLSLQPEPAYIRPDSALATSRAAVAASEQGKAELAKTEEQARQSKKAVPEVRKRAVVKFSRNSQSYSVQYHEYDGSGALPDVQTDGRNLEPLQAPRQVPKAEVARLLKAPVVEREQSADAIEEINHQQSDVEATSSPKLSVRFSDEVVEEKEEHEDETALPVTEDEQDDDDDELFDTESAKPTPLSGIPFVRAWGVLNCWLTDAAKAFLAGGEAFRFSEERMPGHKGRRNLLRELLSSRLPGELSFMSSRFYDLVSCLGVHQTLPSVTETQLYDLLAATLLKGLMRADADRGLYSIEPFHHAILERKLKVAAESFGVSPNELQTLQDMVT